MASQTLQWRVDRAKQLLRKFHPSADVPDQYMRLNVHLARNDVFRRYMPTREYLFRNPAVSLADQAALPSDWLRYADNATYGNGGIAYPVEYIPVEKIPLMNNNAIMAAHTDSPKLFVANRLINTAPSGLTFLVDYYQRPTDLWNSANSIPLSTTDFMPMETEYSIVRGAFERGVRMTSGLAVSRQLIEKNEMESQQAALEWYEVELERQVKDVQPFI